MKYLLLSFLFLTSCVYDEPSPNPPLPPQAQQQQPVIHTPAQDDMKRAMAIYGTCLKSARAAIMQSVPASTAPVSLTQDIQNQCLPEYSAFMQTCEIAVDMPHYYALEQCEYASQQIVGSTW